jgi:hypothetical protein
MLGNMGVSLGSRQQLDLGSKVLTIGKNIQKINLKKKGLIFQAVIWDNVQQMTKTQIY